MAANGAEEPVLPLVQMKFKELLYIISGESPVGNAFVRSEVAPQLNAFRDRCRLDTSVTGDHAHSPDQRPLGVDPELRHTRVK